MWTSEIFQNEFKDKTGWTGTIKDMVQVIRFRRRWDGVVKRRTRDIDSLTGFWRNVEKLRRKSKE